jgi:hypothetical protein
MHRRHQPVLQDWAANQQQRPRRGAPPGSLIAGSDAGEGKASGELSNNSNDQIDIAMPIHAMAIDATNATDTILMWVSRSALLKVIFMTTLRCTKIASS